MNNNLYIIDSSSLIQLNRNNPMDVFPTVWNKLEVLIKKNRLIAPKEVLNEINQKDDQLSEWAKKQKKMFKEPTEKQIEFVKKILKEYPSLVNTESKHSADPWVIALTKELITDKQKTLIEIKRIVVSEEKIRGNKVKIPHVCKQYNLEHIDIITMFRIENWIF